MKKILLTALALCLLAVCLVVMPGKAQAATYGPLTYEVTDGQVTITGCDTATEGVLEIPATFDGYPVTAIGDWAFYSCTELTAVTIPDSVTTIGPYAFSTCQKLSSVNIPASLTSLGEYAFFDCISLTDIRYDVVDMADLPSSNYVFDFAGQSSAGITLTVGAQVRRIPGNLFCPYPDATVAPNLVSIQFQEGSLCHTIGDNAFYNCTELTEIKFTSVNMNDLAANNNAFYNAGQNGDGIRLTIGAQVTKIPAYLFYPCQKASNAPKLASVSFEAGSVCATIGDSAFRNCKAMTSVTFPDSLTVMGKNAFQACTGLTSVDLPNSLINLGDYAFYNCSGLTDFTIPGSVKFFGTYVLSGCTNLKWAIIESGVSSIGMYCFDFCTGLTWVVIPETVTTISTHALHDNELLADVLYAGTEAQWDAITLGSYNSALRSADKHFGVYYTETCVASGWFCPDCDEFIVEGPAVEGTHDYVLGVCASCGHIPYPIGGFVNDTYTGYNDLAAAVATSNWVKLFEDTDAVLSLTKDLYIDLNGFDLTGTITTNGYQIYGMDSATDGYTCDKIGYMTLVDEAGKDIVPVTQFKTDTAKRYLAIRDLNGYSFHRFYLGITHITLKPTVCGMGFKATFFGDSMVAASLGRFGYTLWLDGNEPVNVTIAASQFVSGKTLTLRVDGFDVENHGETELRANATMLLADGTMIESATETLTMRSFLEALNSKAASLTAAQLTAIREMIEKHTVIKSWNTQNLC